MDKLQKSTTNDLIELFKPLNPCYERLFSNKTQRQALERLVKKFGEEKIKKSLMIHPKCMKQPYCPVITTPYQFEQKLGQLLYFFEQLKNMSKEVKGVDLSQLK